MNNTNGEQYEQEGQVVTYASATAIVAEEPQNRAPLPVGTSQMNVDFYTNPYVYVQDPTTNNNLISTSSLPTNFFPTAYFPSTAPLDLLWAPWSFEMIHGELSSPLVDYHSQQFGNSSNQLHNRLPPLQSGLIPNDFPLQSFMTRSATNNGVSNYGTRSQVSGRKGGRRPREIEDKDQYDMNPEDRDKRAKRRQRNKEAAARCRKRRMDLMETLQMQVDKLKEENSRKQMTIDQLNQQTHEMMEMLRVHNCHLGHGMMDQQIRHLQMQSSKDQEQMYKARIQQSIQLKMEHDSMSEQLHAQLGAEMNDELETIFKDEQLGLDDRASPDQYPITTCSMIINNEDPVISHASFQSSNSKRSKHNQSPMISDSNDGPTFSRPNTLPLVSQYSDMSNNLPSLNTPSAGLSGYSNDFSVLNQQTFLTPMTLGPIPVTSHADTPSHGELRQL